MISAVVFDLDDTLFNENEYVQSGYKVVNNWIKEEYKVNGFYEKAIHLFNSSDRKQVFNKTLESLNIPYDKPMIEKMVRIYRSHYPEINMLDDAKWVLNHLKNTVKTGLISDGYKISQEKKVEALKIKDTFDIILLTDTFGKENWKPSSFPYEYIKKFLKCSHHECVYIGDNPKKDFITAKKLGWSTVQIKRKEGIYSNVVVESQYRANYQVEDLKELLSLMEFQHIFNTCTRGDCLDANGKK